MGGGAVEIEEDVGVGDLVGVWEGVVAAGGESG